MSDSLEDRLDEVTVAYLRAVDAGEPIDEQALIDANPDLATPLRQLFADERWRGRRPPLLPEGVPLGPFGGYTLEAEVGRGSMGVVYRARQVSPSREVALKMILAGHLAGPDDVLRFRHEAEAAAGLDHPNIVPVYEVGEHQGQPYFTMRLVPDGSLSSQLARFRDRPHEIARLMAKVARAIHHAHQHGILHRDLKPANILLDPAGEPLVTDFGLAKRLDAESGRTEPGAIVGTLEYMAPEQGRGARNLTWAVDVYALGGVLYALLTGRAPVQGDFFFDVLEQVLHTAPDRPRSLNPGADADLEAVCLKCLEKDPGKRYKSAEELAEELDRYLRGEGVRARPPGLGTWLVQVMRTQPRAGTHHPWQPVAWLGGIRLAAHLSIFAFALAGWSILWAWAAMALHWLGFGIVIYRQYVTQYTWLPETTRHSMMIATGHLLATMILAFTYMPLSPEAPSNQALGMYPALGVLHGIVFFTLGSTHWSRFYLLGLLSLVLVPAMARWPDAAPLLLGVSYAACMWYWAYALGVTFRQPAIQQTAAQTPP